MTDSNVTDLPVDVDLDLDALETNPNAQPPFKVRVGGRVVQFKSPEDLDWRDVATLTDPLQLFRICLSPEDRKHIFEQGFPAWKLNDLFEKFSVHFGLEERMAEARRRGIGAV